MTMTGSMRLAAVAYGLGCKTGDFLARAAGRLPALSATG